MKIEVRERKSREESKGAFRKNRERNSREESRVAFGIERERERLVSSGHLILSITQVSSNEQTLIVI